MKKQAKPHSQRYDDVGSRRAKELGEAIRERRFQPWHAADLLDMAGTAEEFEQAVESITALVARGNRREDH